MRKRTRKPVAGGLKVDVARAAAHGLRHEQRDELDHGGLAHEFGEIRHPFDPRGALGELIFRQFARGVFEVLRPLAHGAVHGRFDLPPRRQHKRDRPPEQDRKFRDHRVHIRPERDRRLDLVSP